MQQELNIAILGATGLVGEHLIKILEQRQTPVKNLYPLASQRSAGKTIYFHGKPITVIDVATFDFSQAQYGLFSAGGSVSAQYAPVAVDAGCTVIDNTSHFRNDLQIPLIISEVNFDCLSDYTQQTLIANPNCSTMQMLVALKPIYDAVGITRINVATYQAVSGSGRQAQQELLTQTQASLANAALTCEVYPQPIAFNVIPHIDTLQDNGYTREEMKMVWETQKILADDSIQVNPTAVRVPVLNGHAEALHIETRDKLTAEQARVLLSQAPGIELADYPTPRQSADGQDPVFVGRIREDISHPLGLNLWVVADNIRKGAALNAVQILEKIIEQ